MRLIDADEFIITAKVGIMLASMCTNNEVKKEILKATYELIKERIDDAPTVDAVPLRHGKWIVNVRRNLTREFKCSVCDKSICFNYDTCFHEYDYCPFCGAKMDGGDKNA